MSYLNDFYTDAAKAGFSKDYQIALTQLSLGGQDYKDLIPFSYAKKIQIPVAKVTAFKEQMLFGNIIPLLNGASDYEGKSNYPITFWSPNNTGPVIEAFNNYTGSTPTDTDNITFDLLNDQNKTIYTIELQKVSVKNVSQVNYSTDGTGKPQEFTVTFTFEDVLYNPVTQNQDKEVQGYGSTDDGKPNAIDINAFSKFRTQNFTASGPNNTNALQTIIGGIKTFTRGVQAVGNAASSIRSASRAIRGR